MAQILTLIRIGCPSKIDETTKRKLFREANKRPRATLKELKQLFGKYWSLPHMTTIS